MLSSRFRFVAFHNSAEWTLCPGESGVDGQATVSCCAPRDRRNDKVGTCVAIAMAALRHRSTTDVPNMRMTSMTAVYLLPNHLHVDSSLVDRVRCDYDRLAWIVRSRPDAGRLFR